VEEGRGGEGGGGGEGGEGVAADAGTAMEEDQSVGGKEKEDIVTATVPKVVFKGAPAETGTAMEEEQSVGGGEKDSDRKCTRGFTKKSL